MKTLIKKLKKIEKDIIKKVEQRDKKSLSRSDKWHDSPQGKIYEHQTGRLADSVDGIKEAISNIESFLE